MAYERRNDQAILALHMCFVADEDIPDTTRDSVRNVRRACGLSFSAKANRVSTSLPSAKIEYLSVDQ